MSEAGASALIEALLIAGPLASLPVRLVGVLALVAALALAGCGGGGKSKSGADKQTPVLGAKGSEVPVIEEASLQAPAARTAPGAADSDGPS